MDLVVDLKSDLHSVLQVYVPEKLMAVEADLQTCTAWEQNWYQRPPAIIYKNGVPISSGFDIDYDTGTLFFSVDLLVTDRITAEFFYSPFTDEQLTTFLERACAEVGAKLSLAVDTQAIPDALQALVVDFAYVRTFTAVMAETAMYHKWIRDGVEVHKDMVTKNHQMVLAEKRAGMTDSINRLRLSGLSGGQVVATTATAQDLL
jgi:hypothetical protein